MPGKAITPETSYGNTFANVSGNSVSVTGVEPVGEINYDNRNRKRFSEGIEFNGVYGMLKDNVMSRLVAPVTRVELTDYQVYLSIY